MSLRDTITSQQLLAVSLAVIMLVSMGGMAFIGSAGAQTGGTFDQTFNDQQVVNNQLNIDDADGDVLLVGDTGDLDQEVQVGADGSIEFTGTPSAEFAGVALTPERVAAVNDVDASVENPADFLNASGDEFEAVGDGFPAIFAEFDPQSEFSQIEGTDEDISSTEGDGDTDVSGTHDGLIIGEAQEVTGLVDEDIADENAGEYGVADTDIVALSVANEAGPITDYTVISAQDNFGGVFEELVGDEEADLQNKNIENVLFAAGSLGASDGDSITALQLDDDIANNVADGETIHSEKITLNAGEDERFFASISEADANATNNDVDGDVVDVAAGAYDAAEDDPIALTTDNITINGAEAGVSGEDRLDGTTVAESVDETTIVAQVDVTDVDDVTIDGVVVEDDSDTAVTLGENGSVNPTFVNSIVDYSGTGTAVNFAPERPGPEGQFANNAIIADEPEEFNHDDTGLNVGNDIENVDNVDVSANLFIGFATQVDLNDNLDAEPFVETHAEQFADDRAQAAIPVDADGDVVGDAIEGSIANADEFQAEEGNTVSVSAGTYFENDDLVLGHTNDVEFIGTDDDNGVSLIEDNVGLEGTTDVTFQTFEVDGDVTADTQDDNNPIVTVEDVELTATGSTLTVNDASDVTIEEVTFTDAGTDGIAITDETDSVLINEITVTDLTDGTGVDIQDTASGADVTNVTLTGPADATDVTGISVAEIDTDAANNYTVNDNDLTDLGNGTGIAVAEDTGGLSEGEEGTVAVNNNVIVGGAELIGISYDLDETRQVTVFQNEIIGENVQNGDASVAIDVDNVREEATDDTVLGVPEDVDGPQFAENVISGHAHVVNIAEADDSVSFEYNQFLAEDTFNNTVGTLVTAPEDQEYQDVFGSLEAAYLPGSVAEAVDLVEDAEDVTEADLQVYDPELEHVDEAPDTYVDDEVEFNDADAEVESITVTGETEDVTVETNFVIQQTSNLDNHNLADLTIINDGSEDAIAVNSENAQSSFDNLDVESAGDAFTVDTSGDDVNVVSVTESDFNVTDGTSNGIVLNADGDDRDGFVIDDVTIDGAGISDDATGLDLTGVEKPGKDGLDTNLTVTGVTVNDFDKQVVLSDELTDIDGLNASSVLEGDFVATDQVEIEFTDMSFEQAVLVKEDHGDDVTLADAETLYGSIDTADANTDTVVEDTAVLDVRAGTFTEDVSLGTQLDSDTNNLVVEGPANGVEATEAFRSTGEALIVGTVSLDTSDDAEEITLDGLTVVADSDTSTSVIDVDNANADAVNVNNTAVSALGNETTGLPEESITGVTISEDSDVTLYQSFVGDHDEVQTTNTSIDVRTGTLTVEDSTLEARSDTDDGVGVDVDSTAGDHTVDIINSDIANHSDAGFSVDDTDAIVTLNASTVDGNLEGVLVRDASSIDIEAGTQISDNAVGLVVDETTAAVTVTDSEITESDREAVLVDANVDSLELVANEFTDSAVGLNITDAVETSAVDDDSIINNSFAANADAEIRFDADDTASSLDELNVTLNYLGDRTGPFGPDSAGIDVLNGAVDENVVYDPFLTSSEPVDGDVTTTTAFGHDVVIMPDDGFTTVGVPAEHEADNLGELFGGDADGFGFDGEVYAFDADAGEFSGASADDDVGAFDAYVVDYDGEEPISFLVEYESNPQAAPVNTQLQEGLNFVAPPAAANSSIFNQDVDNGDTVQERFGLGSNLYGTGTPSDADFVTPAERFTDGEGTQEVHPHAGYFVTIQEDSQEPIVSDRIFPGVTVDQIEGDTKDSETLVA